MLHQKRKLMSRHVERVADRLGTRRERSPAGALPLLDEEEMLCVVEHRLKERPVAQDRHAHGVRGDGVR